LLGLSIGLFLFHRLTRHIRLLKSAADRFTDSEFSLASSLSPIAASESGDEVAQLAKNFEKMAERILEQYGALQNQDRLRREMIANVSHDLRTPLAALHGYLERLQDKWAVLNDEDRLAYINVALSHSTRLNGLIENLFELSMLEARESEPSLETFSLTELVQDVLQKFRLQARAKNIELRFSYAKQLPQVRGDIGLLDRALSNLVDNAIAHSGEGGCVTLAVEKNQQHISVKVSDTGKGIAPEHLDSIFQRFYRADQQHRGSDKHAGLGLAIARRILELHGQTIRVSSKLNIGTVFHFNMPAVDPHF
ncbi:MAG: HAMP domain-containing sensor histidine kinase, partial [Pseudomonadota bacterium]